MLWCKGMNTGALQLVGVISVPVIIPVLPLPLAIVAIPVAYWLISISCRLFFLSDMTAGDFPGGNRGCHALHRASRAVSARPLRGCGSGSRNTLLCSRPLRTERASFPALRSSLYKPSMLRAGFTTVMELTVAVRMQHHQIIQIVASSLCFSHNVMNVPASFLAE